ncbi:MAG: aminotransferase class I/II-fold pyridoxal phosphate-dependent enzyme [Deltaproteobacteria bacterium]|nr:MAG: aminotransferase class I/II-fold pyridoxal phosphate-dependent enzyme [Deltaproteobacteria bacterium]
MFSPQRTMPPSLTVSFHAQAHQMKEKGQTVYDLTAGEAKLPTHPLLLEALQEQLSQQPVYYASSAGLSALREQTTSWLNRTYQTSYAPSECLVTAGGKFGLYLVFATYLKPGSEVIVPSPYWVTYPSLVSYFGGQPVIVPTQEEQGFKFTPEALQASITDNTQMLVLNNAGNPTGALYTHDEIAALLDVAAAHDLLVVSDEVYSALVYEGSYASCGSFDQHKARVFVIQSCSKSFAMTGWRVGFLLGPQEAMPPLQGLQSQSLTSTSTASQWAAQIALSHADTITTWVRDEMRQRRDAFVSACSDIFNISLRPPASALYAFLPLSLLGFHEELASNSMRACQHLLEQAQVVTVPGVGFGYEGYVRCSFAGNPEQNTEALQRIHQTLQP